MRLWWDVPIRPRKTSVSEVISPAMIVNSELFADLASPLLHTQEQSHPIFGNYHWLDSDHTKVPNWNAHPRDTAYVTGPHEPFHPFPRRQSYIGEMFLKMSKPFLSGGLTSHDTKVQQSMSKIFLTLVRFRKGNDARWMALITWAL